MYRSVQTNIFRDWLRGMKDRKAKQRITQNLNRLEIGGLCNTKHLGNGLQECKLNYGPGYRIYYSIQSENLLILLCGGDKGSQQNDISRARSLLNDYLRS